MRSKRIPPRRFIPPPPVVPSHYAVLGVDRDATLNQIRRAYREMAKDYHPDHNPAGRKVFEQVKRAWDVLSEGREAYDRSLGIHPAAPAFAEAGMRLAK
jgi:DnaJ-class molecular chaperone